MSHRSRRYRQGRQGTATTREDRRSHSRSHDESDREQEDMVRTREDRCGHRRCHDEWSVSVLKTAQLQQWRKDCQKENYQLKMDDTRERQKRWRMERCLQTLGAGVKKEPRIAKWEEGQCPEKFFVLFEAVMDDYRIDESQWMKHIKPSLTEDAHWMGSYAQTNKRNYDKFQELIITRVEDSEA